MKKDRDMDQNPRLTHVLVGVVIGIVCVILYSYLQGHVVVKGRTEDALREAELNCTHLSKKHETELENLRNELNSRRKEDRTRAEHALREAELKGTHQLKECQIEQKNLKNMLKSCQEENNKLRADLIEEQGEKDAQFASTHKWEVSFWFWLLMISLLVCCVCNCLPRQDQHMRAIRG